MSLLPLVPANAEEPVRWIMRPDLEIIPSGSGSSATWVVKDPLRLTYFQAPAEELAFLSSLDGRASLAEVLGRLQQRFPESTFSLQNLTQFLAAAIQGGVLRSTECGFGSWISATGRRRRTQAARRKLLSLLVHRVRGIDPTPLLRWLHPGMAWLYHRSVIALALLFIVCVAIVVGVRLQHLQLELSSLLLSLMTVQNLPLIVISIVAVKILHELGHALTCHHYGGECHELGFLFVGFIPLLYCDVSDSWAQQNRWKRMLVAAAGILTELFLAAVFGLLWIFSVPGLLHAFCLNAMIVCSVNTLVVNGNPLLRYDGYYVLCDLIQIPNLSSESRQVVVNAWNRVVFGTPSNGGTFRHPLTTLAIGCYGACSILYRLFLVVLILLGVHHILASVGLESLTVVFVVSTVLGQLAGVVQVVQSALQRSPARGRFYTGGAVLLTVIVSASVIPFPCSVEAPFVLQPGGSKPVYVQVAGYLDPHVQAGQTVQQGQRLATLRNPELELQLAQTAGDVLQHQARVASLTSRRTPGSAAGNALPAAEDAVMSAELRLKTLQQRVDDLLIESPADGTVISPRNLPASPFGGPTMQSLSGVPLDLENRGAWQTEQTLLCWIGSPSQFRAVAVVAQNDIELIDDQAVVTLRFASAPGRTESGHVVLRSPVPETKVDRELVINQLVATSSRAADEPQETVFAVHVQPEATAALAPLYSTGSVRIRCQPMSLAARTWRMLCHTFSFRL